MRIQGTLSVEQYPYAIWPLRNGPRRDDINTQCLTCILERGLRYRFNWVAISSDLFRTSTVQNLIYFGMPHTCLTRSRLSAIDVNRASNASSAYGRKLCDTTDINKEVPTWKDWRTLDNSPSHCLIFANRSLRRRSPLMPFILEHFLSTRSIPSSSLDHCYSET